MVSVPPFGIASRAIEEHATQQFLEVEDQRVHVEHARLQDLLAALPISESPAWSGVPFGVSESSRAL